MRALIDGSAPRCGAPSLGELRERRIELAALCARHGASNLRVFGSVARQEEDAASDLDILVDLERDRSLFGLAALVDELEQLLGCPADVTIADSVKPRLAERILGEAVTL